MRTFNKMTVTKSYKIATMEDGQIKFITNKVKFDELTDIETARVFKYAVTAKKYLDKVNAKARLSATGKERMKNRFYLIEGNCF